MCTYNFRRCRDLKFLVSGGSKQTNKHIYTRVRNAVMLVWGSLRLAPNNYGAGISEEAGHGHVVIIL